MIKLNNKSDCCGCSACSERCPKHCISMREDEEGFLYPLVDGEACIDCRLCEKVCPVINQYEPRKPLNVFAAKNNDEEIRMNSSSGGVFTALAERTIRNGGVVFGAKFGKNWEVEHGYTETLDGLSAFRGSKYMQSVVGDSYKDAERFLKSGREVLFSGTPCHIAGLKLYLRKEYEELLSVDFVCHGVPSPGVWREYLKEECARQCAAGKNTVLSHPLNPEDVRITDIQFRNKVTGWKKYSFSLTLSVPEGTETNSVFLSEPLNKNMFMRGFLSNLYLRPSCYACPSKCFKSGSDITLGDFWGIENVMPKLDDDKGVGLLIINTEKGKKATGGLNIENTCTDYKDALRGNSSLEHSVAVPKKRNEFYEKFKKEPVYALISQLTKVSRTRRGIFLAKRIAKKLLGK